MNPTIPDPLPDDTTYFQVLIDSQASGDVHLSFTANRMSLTSPEILGITWLTGGGPQCDDWTKPVMQTVNAPSGVSGGANFKDTYDIMLTALPLDASGKFRVLKVPFLDPADSSKSLAGSGHLTITLGAAAVMQINGTSPNFAFALPSPDPNGAGGKNHWDFVEFNCATPSSNSKSVCFINTTNVDFFSLGIAIKGRQPDGTMATFGLDLSSGSAVTSLVDALKLLPSEYQAGLVPATGPFLRFLAPGMSFSDGAQSLDSAIADGFAHYGQPATPLEFSVSGTKYWASTVNGALAFTQPKSFSIAKPTTKQVIASTGPLDTGSTSDPVIQNAMKFIDAALNRGIFTDASTWSTPEKWYPAGVAFNEYARLLHQRFLGGACYGFSFDDVPGSPVTSAPAIGTCTSMALVITGQ